MSSRPSLDFLTKTDQEIKVMEQKRTESERRSSIEGLCEDGALASYWGQRRNFFPPPRLQVAQDSVMGFSQIWREM